MSEPEIKEQTLLYATDVKLQCPHCGEWEDGFVGNPSGHQFDCDSCGKPYRVHREADIEFNY